MQSRASRTISVSRCSFAARDDVLKSADREEQRMTTTSGSASGVERGGSTVPVASTVGGPEA
jgi:hypothetical protein